MRRLAGSHLDSLNADAILIAYTHNPEAGWDLLNAAPTIYPPAPRHAMLVNHGTWELADGSHGLVDFSDASRPATTGCASSVAAPTRSQVRRARQPRPGRRRAGPRSMTSPKYRTPPPRSWSYTRDLLHRNLRSRTPWRGESTQAMSTLKRYN